jgi:hypothetical protein
MIRLLLFVLATSVVLAGERAQSGGKKDNFGEVEVLFANGSLVRLTLVQEKIDIETQYGKLSVPLTDVRRIEFGLHMPEGMDKKVGSAIQQLGSGDFKEREGAVRELVALGVHAYPAVLKATKSPDLEVAKRALDAATRIRAKVAAKELGLGADDRVVTAKFIIVGRILTRAIKARTEYFGDAQLSLPQLRHLRVLVDSKDGNVIIDAGKYANANEWLDTNVMVDATSMLIIAASGQIDLRPQEPGTILCGPQGYGPAAGGGFNAGGPGGKGKNKGGGFAPASRVYPGVLLGRIGDDGEIFVIGERYEGMPDRQGKLFLNINPSRYDTTSTGTYQVRVSTRN